MQPLKFNHILKPKIWGGERISSFKKLSSKQQHVGESWELSGLKGYESVVADGTHAGKTITEVLRIEKEKLLGKENYRKCGNEFPLLVKLIDAKSQLSVQVHPNNEQAQLCGMKNGKSEMWYVMDAERDASLWVGLKKKISQEQCKKMLTDHTIVDAMDKYPVKSGDCFYIPGGRIHSIGAGTFLAEIQQSCDVTYRIYDFDRQDKDGNKRQLHTSEALNCLDYNVLPNYKTYYEEADNKACRMVNSPFFKTSVYKVTKPLSVDLSPIDSFVIWIGIEGSSQLKDNEGNVFSFSEGETILIPATTQKIEIEEPMKFLQVFI